MVRSTSGLREGELMTDDYRKQAPSRRAAAKKALGGSSNAAPDQPAAGGKAKFAKVRLYRCER